MEIKTPSGNEAAINTQADRIAENALDAGLIFDRRASANVVGDVLKISTSRHPYECDRRRILILAHLDTVHPQGGLAGNMPLLSDGDRLYGPAVYDMKAGALMAFQAMKLAAASAMPENLPVDLLFVTDEEIGSHSSRGIIADLSTRASAALVMEPAEMVARSSSRGRERRSMT